MAALLAGRTDTSAGVRRSVAEGLGRIGGERAVVPLAALLHDPSPEVRRGALEALGKIGGEQATVLLISLLRDPSLELRRSAIVALDGALIEALREPDDELRRQTQEVLAGFDDARVLVLMLEELDRRREAVAQLLEIISRITDPAAAPQLIRALVELTCRSFGQEQGLWREWLQQQGSSFPLGKYQKGLDSHAPQGTMPI